MSEQIHQASLKPTDRRLLLIGGLTLAAIITIAFVPRVPQDQAYHDFADQRSFIGIANCLNVISKSSVLDSSSLRFVVRRKTRLTQQLCSIL